MSVLSLTLQEGCEYWRCDLSHGIEQDALVCQTSAVAANELSLKIVNQAT
jgi:hypothetical protein